MRVALIPIAWRLLPAAATLATPSFAQDWQSVTPTASNRLAIAYDIARNRIVQFGNVGTAGLLADTWEYNGSWHKVPTATSPPNHDQAMVYDLSSGYSVLFDSFGNNGVGSTWEFDGVNWGQVATANAPPSRTDFAIAADVMRGRVVLFGGADANSVCLGDTWEFDGVNWTQRIPATSPSARTCLAMAFDMQRGRCVMFGGLNPANWRLGETWEYDGTTWTLATTSMAAARSRHSLVYDIRRARTVMYGGNVGALMGTDTWEYDGASWTQVITATAPPTRTGQVMAYDAARARTVMLGGWTGSCFDCRLWEYDGTNWSTEDPIGRSGSAQVCDVARSTTVLFGGMDAHGDSWADTWEYHGPSQSWSQVLTPNAPPTRNAHGMAFDIGRSRAVMFGGRRGNTIFGDTWEYDGTNWTQAVTAAAPSARSLHAMIYDFGRRCVVLFGGTDTYLRLLADTWEYDGTNWVQPALPTAPSGRSGHAMVYDTVRHRTVLFGGTVPGPGGLQAASNETWEYDGTAWGRVLTPGTPGARRLHAMAYDIARMRTLVFGGTSATATTPDTWEYDGATWTQVNTATTPFSSGAMSYEPARGRTVLYSGSSGASTGPVWGLWEIGPAAVPTFERRGDSCASALLSPPNLDRKPNSLPALGTVFDTYVNLLPMPHALLLLSLGGDLVQWNGTPLPLDLGAFGLPGCQLWAAPMATSLLFAANGSASVSLSIPNDASLAGVMFAMQAFVLDPAAPLGLGAASNAGLLRIH